MILSRFLPGISPTCDKRHILDPLTSVTAAWFNGHMTTHHSDNPVRLPAPVPSTRHFPRPAAFGGQTIDVCVHCDEPIVLWTNPGPNGSRVWVHGTPIVGIPAHPAPEGSK